MLFAAVHQSAVNTNAKCCNLRCTVAGPDVTEPSERAAELVDRIFKGARPADLPFERPTRYPFMLNLKRPRASGWKFRRACWSFADQVIE